MIKIYTDGSCLKNPGSGGWAAVIIENGQERVISGSEKYTTNNQMELLATIKALEEFSNKENITIVTDSKYVKDGITNWIQKWEINNWKTLKAGDDISEANLFDINNLPKLAFESHQKLIDLYIKKYSI